MSGKVTLKYKIYADTLSKNVKSSVRRLYEFYDTGPYLDIVKQA